MGSISPDPITGDPVDGVWLPTDYDLGPGDTGALDAIEHEKHARHHRKAAKALEKFEAKECAEIPPEARVACPLLGPVTGFDAIEGGVRLHTDGRRPLSMLLSHARCHYAFGRASGFAEMASCPLYIEGLELELSPDGAGIDLTSPVPATAEEIRSRTATHVVPTVGGK